MKHIALPFALATASITSAALADTTMTYSVDNGNELTMHLTDAALRIDIEKSQWMLYDSSKDVVYVIQDNERQYIVMDRDSMKKVANQMDAAMAEMREQMKSMSPQERAMMEQMMGGKFTLPDENSSTTKPTIRKTGETGQYAGYSCTRVDYQQEGNENRLCVTSAKELGVSDAEMRTAKKMMALMAEMASASAFSKQFSMPDFNELGGLPIHAQDSDGQYQQTLKSVSHDKVPANRLKLPAGYSRRSMQ